MIAGFSAILIYKLQEKDKQKTAGKMIVEQIRQIETCIKILKSEDKTNALNIYKSQRILAKNLWEENRHLISKKLRLDDIRVIEDFYLATEVIEKSRESICDCIQKTWENKNLIYQYQLSQQIILGETQEDTFQLLLQYDKSELTYFPNYPFDCLKKKLLEFNFVSGTVAFEKLCKIAKQ